MASKGVWDATADRKLLLGILKTHQISVDNVKMAEYMSTEGYTFTASAIQNRMKRLKSMVKNGDANGGEHATNENGDTPQKRRAVSTPASESSKTKGKTTKSKKAKVGAEAEDNDENDAVSGNIIKDEVVSEDEL